MNNIIKFFILSTIFFIFQPINHIKAQYSVLLGEYETKYAYKGEKANRASNIELASSKLNNLIIKPLETVSYNTTVGPRTYSKGFRKAPAIINGELEDSMGGGVCQVAGTLHAAAFFAPLEIVESTQHTRISSYIEPGLDSTVFWKSRDLKLKNPYDFPVMIIIKNYRDNKRGYLNIKIYGKRKVYDVEHENIVHYKSKIRVKKIINPNFKPRQINIIEHGTPAMRLIRIRRWFYHETRTLYLCEDKELRYNHSSRIIEVSEQQ